MDKRWSVYIVRCCDGTYYTGITTDIERRVKQHNAGRGAKYTAARTPVILEVVRHGFARAEAMSIERMIKKMPKRDKVMKLILLNNDPT